MKKIVLCLSLLFLFLMIGIMTMPANQVATAPPNQDQSNYFCEMQAIVAPMDIGSPGQRLYASRINLDDITRTAVTTDGTEKYAITGRYSRFAAPIV
jgi:hypothetical protein